MRIKGGLKFNKKVPKKARDCARAYVWEKQFDLLATEWALRSVGIPTESLLSLEEVEEMLSNLAIVLYQNELPPEHYKPKQKEEQSHA